jgi:hypothetical protein
LVAFKSMYEMTQLRWIFGSEMVLYPRSLRYFSFCSSIIESLSIWDWDEF